MPSRTYQVNYDIMANTQGAVQEFNKLLQPMADVAAQARAAQEAFAQITEMSRAFKSNFSNFNIKPTIDLTSFKTSLASMEQNVKESAIRIRSAIESSLGGTRKAFEQNASLLGTNNWKKAEATETQMLKSRQQKLEALQKLYRKLSIENMRGKSKVKHLGELGELNKWFDTMASTKPIERVRSLLMENGIGNILSKNTAGKLIATDMSKLRDFTKLYKQQTEEFSAQQEKALKSNLSRTPGLLGQLSKRSGSFVSGLLGATPEEINNLKSAMSAIGGLMGGVQQTQEKVQNVVKKIPIAKPLKPKGLPTMKEMAKLGKEIESSAANGLAWSRDNEIRTWERLEKAGKLDNVANGRKTLEKLRAQRDIWVKSQAQTANTPELEAKKAQYGTYQKQWESFRKNVAAWRAKPYTETTEQVITSANNAKAATAQPIKLDIRGNFAKQIQPLIAVGKALNSIPKTPVEVPVNINITSGAVSALQAIKTNLQGINAVRGKIAKGGFGKLEKIASSSKATIGNSSVRAALDRTTLGGDLRTSIQNLTRISKRDFVRVKAVLDRTTLAADLRNSINNLTRVASRYPVRLRAALDRTTLGSDLRKSIENLSRLAKEKPFSIKARFDATTLKEDLNKALSSLKTSGKNAPVIKVTLDTASAVEKLNALVSKIKSVSPQSIKLGATTSQATISNTARQPREYVGSNSRAREISNIAASTAAMNRFTQANKPGIVDRLRKHMYPLTGNVSLGASTPVALDMAKGMGIMYGVGGAMNLVTGGLHDAMEYQNTMETAEEILKRNYSGKNFNKDFNDMTNEVRRVAKQTKFTAPQAADATRFMAMAGLSIPMIKSSVSPIADVAVIGDNDFGEVADKMTNIQTAFKIKPDKMRHVADAITNTFSKTNTDMMMIAESMQYAAPMAHLTGMSLEDALAMVGIMGNSGIQASMAGTTLRMMMQNTLNPNKKQSALWKKLGVHTRDKNGNLRNMIDILSDVKKASEDKKLPMADIVSSLFRVTASAGAGSLITNIDAVKKLAAQNKAVGNISTEVSAKKQNTVKGLWAQMTSAFTEANLKVFEQFQEDIKGMIKAVRDYFSSKEAVENLRNAFNLIKDVVRIFGWFAKKWMSLYNAIPGIVKFVVAAQFAASQIGLLVKPILSLINVLGGLKGMTVGLVSALSGVGGLKKVAVAASVASAVVGGGSANAATSNKTILNGAARSAMIGVPYAAYDKNMKNLMLKQATYDFSFYRLQKRALENDKYKSYLIHGSPMLWNTAFTNPEKASKAYAEAKSKYVPNDRHKNAAIFAQSKSARIEAEMEKLRTARVNALKEASRMRTSTQVTDLALMYRYHRSKFYNPETARPEAVRFFSEQEKRMTKLREARRAQQLQNASGLALYRAGKIKSGSRRVGFGNVLKGGFTSAYTALSFKSMTTGFFSSLKSGFFSLISGISKAIGALVSPIGLAVVGITALGAASVALDRQMSKEAEESRKRTQNMIANTNSSSNFGIINYGTSSKQTSFFDIPIPANSKQVKSRNKKYYAAWDDRLFKDGANAKKEANAWANAFIEPNKEIFGSDYSLFSGAAMLKNGNELNKLMNKHASNFAYGNAGTHLYKEANDKDLKNVQRLAQLSTLYIEGANSQKAAGIRKRIVNLREQLTNGKINDEEYQKLTSGLMSKNGLTTEAISKIPKFTGNPGSLKNQADWEKYQQYHMGMYNQLMAEIRGDQNTLAGYYKGIADIKSGVKTYSADWWVAIRRIIGGMKTTIDSAGHAIQIKFDPETGKVQWNNIINQIRKFKRDFKMSVSDFVNYMMQAYGEMVNMGIVGNYFKDWMTFGKSQTKGKVITEADARRYYEGHGYSGERLNKLVKNGFWKEKTNKGGRERERMRDYLGKQIGIDAKRAHDKKMRTLNNKITSSANGTNSNAGGSYTSPIADAAKDTNKGLGGGRYAGATARPTQINIKIDKLANFDKIQFLEGKDRDIAMAIADATAEAVSNLVPMLNGLVTNDKRADMI